MIKLKSQINAGFPNDKCNLDSKLRPYWCVKDWLTIDEADNMIVESIRASILLNLLVMHQDAT
jgi:hypothetical protein